MEDIKTSIDETDDTKTQKVTRKRVRLPAWLIPVILSFLAVAVGVLIVTGRLAVTLKEPSAKVVVQASVCGYDTVEKYNSGIGLYRASDTTEQGLSALKSLSSDIGKRQAYNTDPTCLYIRYQVANIDVDYGVAKSSIDRYAQLVEQGQFADGRLRGISSLDDVKSNLEYLKSASEDEGSSDN